MSLVRCRLHACVSYFFKKNLSLAPAPREEGGGEGDSAPDVENSSKAVRSEYVAFMVWAVKILVCFVFRSSDSVTKKRLWFFSPGVQP